MQKKEHIPGPALSFRLGVRHDGPEGHEGGGTERGSTEPRGTGKGARSQRHRREGHREEGHGTRGNRRLQEGQEHPQAQNPKR